MGLQRPEKEVVLRKGVAKEREVQRLKAAHLVASLEQKETLSFLKTGH